MTGGGVCFGGGEPTLYPEFIRQFRMACGSRWRLTVESALTCTEEVIPEMVRSVDRWIVDVKDLSEEIYEGYTGKRNVIRSKLRVLLDAGAETTVRVPHIPGYNSDADVARTIGELRSMGFVLNPGYVSHPSPYVPEASAFFFSSFHKFVILWCM